MKSDTPSESSYPYAGLVLLDNVYRSLDNVYGALNLVWDILSSLAFTFSLYIKFLPLN